MEDIIRFETVNQYNAFNQQETLHPLVTVIDLSTTSPRKKTSQYMGCYGIFLKDVVCGDLRYGKEYYDYQEGTLVFMSPGQVFTVENDGELYQPKGHAIDKHSRKLIVVNIELFLDYCVRFYDRQFITRDTIHRRLITRFESLLSSYFTSDKPQTIGLPSVAYCAGELNLSAKYFGDLIKKETGQSAQEYIQNKVIEAAKERIFDSSKTINEIAFDLGFKYPQHFSRVFKQRVGQTPQEYRLMN